MKRIDILTTLILFSILMICFRVSGQEKVVAKFSIEAGIINRSGTPVSVSLEGLDYNTEKGTLRLFEIKERAGH